MNIEGLKKQREYVAEICKLDMDVWNNDGNEPKFDDPYKFVFWKFDKEYNCAFSKRMYGNVRERMTQWLMGLPMSFEFENYNILELARSWGYVKDTGGRIGIENSEDRFIENWWRRLADDIFYLAKNTVDTEAYK